MARPKNSAAPDLTKPVNLTVGAIERLTCRSDSKSQAFLRDSVAPGLKVRVTNTGAKSFVFERKLNRKTIRLTIGDVRSWNIEQARASARRLGVLLDEGTDPRELEKQKLIALAASEAAAAVEAMTVGEAWSAYLKERHPFWGDRHREDHLRLAKPGGEKAKNRRNVVTQAGPLHGFMHLRLADLNSEAVELWATEQAKLRPTVARLALRCLKAFLNWCAENPQYASIVQDRNPAKTKKAREVLGKPGVKQDALQREQLSAWFAAVRNLSSPVVAAYLQTLLLTGARPGEVLALCWDDIDWTWKSLTIRDKVDGERVIPLPPYVASLLDSLPRRNKWVFSSPRTNSHMSRLDPMHIAACKVAGIERLTLHGLRRSFASLTEWLEIPAGIVAQIQGHKPSATAEKHYKRRPLDLLRIHHERIEGWILEQAGVQIGLA